MLPGKICLVAQPNSLLIPMTRQMKDVVGIVRSRFDRFAKQLRVKHDFVRRLAVEQAHYLFHYMPLPAAVIELLRRNGLRNEGLQFLHRRTILKTRWARKATG